jgi:uncharacterized protein (TIGR00730 family)
MINRICVFCGSSPGKRPEYTQAALELGLLLVERQITLVYGGGNVGLMGEVARTVMKAGGKVIGAIPRDLVERELVLREVTELHVLESMHERKALMAELADAFIALPGGYGTLDEMSEILTWAQLGIHTKPCGLLNVCGYYAPLTAFFDHMHAEQFVDTEHRNMVIVEDTPAALLARFERYHPPLSDKAAWAKRNSQKK